MPTVTVIIPTYNRSELLRSAISSVLKQTYQNFEIIVVDDASLDNTSDIVSGFQDQRIRYIRHETNRKIAAARNTGVVSSRGDYIAFLDDDDEWLPHKLSLQVDLIERSPPTVGGVYAGSFAVEASSKRVLFKKTPTKRGNIFVEMFGDNCIGPTSAVLLRKLCFDKVGLFDSNLEYAEDYDMWLRIAKDFLFEYIEEPLVKYAIHSQSGLSKNYASRIKGIEAKLKKHGLLFESDKKSYSRHYQFLGVLHCYNGNLKKGRQAFFKAIRLNPFEVRNYFNLLLSLLGRENFTKLKQTKDRFVLKRQSSTLLADPERKV